MMKQIRYSSKATETVVNTLDLSNYEWPEGLLHADIFILSTLDVSALEKYRKIWLIDFLKSDYVLPKIATNEILFFRSLVRDDYKELFHAVIDSSGIDSKVIVEDYKNKSAPPSLNLRASRFMIENQHLYNQITHKDPLIRSILFIKLCYYAYILTHFSQTKPKAAVFFADMQPIERLLIYYFKRQGIPTVTMQHGLYVDYGAYSTVNAINYLHHCSDYFLSWGNNTSNLIKKHHPSSKVVNCGKPLVFNAEPPIESTTDNGTEYISIFLDQKPFHQQNEEMISIVRAFALANGMQIRVRFHPSLPKLEILQKYPYLDEQLHFTDAAFIVGHTSSLMYEALALGCRVLRYKSSIPAIALPPSCEFANALELASCIELSPPPDLHREFFCALGEKAGANYRNFFDKLLGRNQ